MRADGPDARDCREPSVGVEDLVPTGASLVFLVTTKKKDTFSSASNLPLFPIQTSNPLGSSLALMAAGRHCRSHGRGKVGSPRICLHQVQIHGRKLGGGSGTGNAGYDRGSSKLGARGDRNEEGGGCLLVRGRRIRRAGAAMEGSAATVPAVEPDAVEAAPGAAAAEAAAGLLPVVVPAARPPAVEAADGGSTKKQQQQPSGHSRSSIRPRGIWKTAHASQDRSRAICKATQASACPARRHEPSAANPSSRNPKLR